MSDKILLQNMMFYGFHGLNEYEREQGQRFYLDVEIATELAAAGKSDALEDTVDYASVYACVKDITENNRFFLLEALAEKIAAAILTFNKVVGVAVRIRKPAVPIPGQLDYVQVEIKRSNRI